MAVAFVALLAALSGTAIALPGTNTVDSGDIINGQVKGKDIKNGGVAGKDIKNGSVKSLDVGDDSVTGTDINEGTLGKVPSATNADHATNADNATNATNATNAASAANAAKLGGIDAASYVKNTGTIFVSTGSSNWQALHTTDPISWSYTVNATWATSSGAGSWFLTAHPSFSTALYGKNLSATAATLCYSASGSAAISEVDIYRSRYSNSGIGSPSLIASDATDRTDAACRTYTFTSPQALSSRDDIGFVVQATYTGAASLLIGQSGLTLAPTTAVAAAPTSAAQEAHLPTPAAGIVTH
jgi:hypothetical protein